MFTTLNFKEIYKNPWIRVREDKVIRPDGTRGIYGVVETGNSVLLIVINSNGKILLNKQFRYTTQMDSWEFPTGAVEKGESLVDAAQRELQEETGFIAKNIKVIAKNLQAYNGISNGMATVVLAKELVTTEIDQKVEEDIKSSKWLTIKEIEKMILQGEFTDAQCIMALYIAKLLGI